jgi:hypothetical protein
MPANASFVLPFEGERACDGIDPGIAQGAEVLRRSGIHRALLNCIDDYPVIALNLPGFVNRRRIRMYLRAEQSRSLIG